MDVINSYTVDSGDVFEVEATSTSESYYTGNSAYNQSNINVLSDAVIALEEKPDFVGMQPLFPFVEIHVGNQCVTSFSDSFQDTLVDFTYHRTSHYTDSSQANSKFDMTLYDDQALEVEDLLAGQLIDNSGIDVQIRYGYSRSNDERYMTATLDGTVVKYGLTFEGAGLTLTLSGTIRNFNSAVGTVRTKEYTSTDYNGKPSDIVRDICAEEGWEIGYIEETEPVLNNDGSLETFRQENESTVTFINRRLCERSVSAETGDVGYIAYFGEDGKFYFVSSTNTTIDVKVASDEQLAALTLPKEE